MLVKWFCLCGLLLKYVLYKKIQSFYPQVLYYSWSVEKAFSEQLRKLVCWFSSDIKLVNAIGTKRLLQLFFENIQNI